MLKRSTILSYVLAILISFLEFTHYQLLSDETTEMEIYFMQKQ